MRIISLLILCLSILCSTDLAAQALDAFVQEQLPKAKRSPEGIYYSMQTSVKGQRPKQGDYVAVSYVGKLLDGKVFDQSEAGEPLVFQLGRRQVISGWEEGLLYFSKGDKGQLVIPSEKAYGKRGVGNVIPPNADLVFEIELLDIMNQEQYDTFMKKQEALAKAAYEKQITEQFDTDKKLIADYIAQNKLKAQSFSSGLSVVLNKKGKGEFLKDGDNIKVKYRGKLLDGTEFDSNVDGPAFDVTLGKGKTIAGWEEGLKHFKKGAQGVLLIPSKMAYGPRPIYDEDVSIPGNSVLIFEIKVLK